MNIVGIDYSITSPSICIDGNLFYFITPKKKFAEDWNVNGMTFKGLYYDPKKWKHSDLERFSFLSNVFRTVLYSYKGSVVFEGYALGAKGKVFNIAEATGIMKKGLVDDGWSVEESIPPTVIKRYVTGKGNATKDDMAQAWKRDHDFDLFETLGNRNPKDSPASDIVDSYYVWYTYKEKLEGQKYIG